MVMSRTILRIALALSLLSVGLSAQRYTGHDHAVFHRAPQPPSSSVKRQSQPAGPSNKPTPRTGQGTTSSQTAPHAAAGQSRPDPDLNRSTGQSPVDNSPHF